MLITGTMSRKSGRRGSDGGAAGQQQVPAHEVLPPKGWKPGPNLAAGTQAAAKLVVYRIIPVMHREPAHWVRDSSPALPASVAGVTARMAAEGVRMAANN